MNPLFAPDCTLVGWVKDNKYVFSTDLEWVAFIANGHFFSLRNQWLGPYHNGHAVDRSGKVVAFGKSGPVQGTLRPLRPLNPLRPLQPLRPLRPLNPLRPLRPIPPLSGWSSLQWWSWLNQ